MKFGVTRKGPKPRGVLVVLKANYTCPLKSFISNAFVQTNTWMKHDHPSNMSHPMSKSHNLPNCITSYLYTLRKMLNQLWKCCKKWTIIDCHFKMTHLQGLVVKAHHPLLHCQILKKLPSFQPKFVLG